jgi:hypothetical protein
LSGVENLASRPDFSAINLMQKAASIITSLPAVRNWRNGGNSRHVVWRTSPIEVAMLVAA